MTKVLPTMPSRLAVGGAGLRAASGSMTWKIKAVESNGSVVSSCQAESEYNFMVGLDGV